MTENGDVQHSPVPSGEAASHEPKLLWSAYKSFQIMKCNAQFKCLQMAI